MDTLSFVACTCEHPFLATAIYHLHSRVTLSFFSGKSSLATASRAAAMSPRPVFWMMIALCLSTSAQASRRCDATPYWPGWDGIKCTFILWIPKLYGPKNIWLTWSSGDSHTTTSFNDTGTQPSSTNPLGNPTYPGGTASNGPNWVGFLTVKYNDFAGSDIRYCKRRSNHWFQPHCALWANRIIRCWADWK
jgi:hypothetical protein